MRSSNLPSGGATIVDVGLVWEEIQAPGSGSITFSTQKQTTLRISAGALTTVELDEKVSITLRAGEVEVINCGTGSPNDNKFLVEVKITSTDVSVQKARASERGRRNTY